MFWPVALARWYPMRLDMRCRVVFPCLSLVINRNRLAPTITVITRAPTRPPAAIAMMMAIRPPIITIVPSAPRPAMPAEVGLRQLP